MLMSNDKTAALAPCGSLQELITLLVIMSPSTSFKYSWNRLCTRTLYTVWNTEQYSVLISHLQLYAQLYDKRWDWDIKVVNTQLYMEYCTSICIPSFICVLLPPHNYDNCSESILVLAAGLPYMCKMYIQTRLVVTWVFVHRNLRNRKYGTQPMSTDCLP